MNNYDKEWKETIRSYYMNKSYDNGPETEGISNPFGRVHEASVDSIMTAYVDYRNSLVF